MQRSVTSHIRLAAYAAPLALALLAGSANAQALGTQFTYQGQLNVGGVPAAGGTADLRFRVYDAASGGLQQGATLVANNVTIQVDGRFVTELDFGASVSGANARWIEIDVRRPAGSANAFVTLTPRQRLNPTPNASFASSAASATTAANANALSGQNGAFYQNASNLNAGTVAEARLPASVMRTNTNQTVTSANTFNNAANVFTGNGAGLTGINAANISTGALPDARLSSNVALRNGGNTFNGAQTFNGGFVGIGRSTQTTGAERFGIGGDIADFNGMYVTSESANALARPFYGYATPRIFGYSYMAELDEATNTDAWILNVGSDVLSVTNRSRVGVNVVNPSFDLQVASFNDTQIAIQSTSASGRIWSLQSTRGVSGLPHLDAAFQLIDRTAGIAQMTIGSNGKVSFANGTAPGSAKLNVLNDANSLDGIRGWTVTGNGWGVEGRASANGTAGVRGNLDSASFTGAGIEGSASTTIAGSWAGRFFGNVTVQGAFSATSKSFRIDHPQDPANKELWHASIESDQYINVYSGNITTDATGYATITLPAWMEATNHNFRYQLTVIDEGEQQTDFVMARVVSKVANNQFAIKTSAPNVEVSWQLTGERKDAWALKNPLQVEREKLEQNRGKFINPEAFGFGDNKRLEYTSRPEAAATE